MTPAAPDAAPTHDAETLAFYDREAETYAARTYPVRFERLHRFLALLPPGGRVLELGTGGGRDAAEMLRLGFEVTPTDGSAGLAAIAERTLGRPVRIMRFEALDETAAYDGVWANASLLHAPFARLGDILGRVRRALRPGGWVFASFKAGDGPGRDSLGRYYNFPSEAMLRAAYAEARPWASLEIEHDQGGGYDGVERDWLICWGGGARVTDVFDAATRSAVMRRVKAKGTAPERTVRRMIWALGGRYRLNRADLPGKPDIVLAGRRLAVFVHGCFWHGHDCARGARVPKANRDYWTGKIGRNRVRDTQTRAKLEALGWRVETVWECELRDAAGLKTRLGALLQPER